jgi:hypothetical protein
MKATVQLGNKQYTIIGLTVATAIIHLALGLFSDPLNILFVLNGVGYLALLAGFYFLPQLTSQRSLIRWVLIGYTAVTVVLYFVFNWPDVWGPMGIITKVIELALIAMLWMEK